MDARMIAYADVVYALNEARITDTSYPLIEEFKNCCAIVDGSHAVRLYIFLMFWLAQAWIGRMLENAQNDCGRR